MSWPLDLELQVAVIVVCEHHCLDLAVHHRNPGYFSALCLHPCAALLSCNSKAMGYISNMRALCGGVLSVHLQQLTFCWPSDLTMFCWHSWPSKRKRNRACGAGRGGERGDISIVGSIGGGANSGFCVEPRGLPPREQNGINGK